jgi:hypothetical protein
MRPKTLAEVAQLTLAGNSFDHCFANFLDEFYAAPNPEALAGAPILLAPTTGDPGLVRDAYLGAAEARKLHRPWFASPLAALRAVLLLESPAAFRSRNLFISQNALTRA